MHDFPLAHIYRFINSLPQELHHEMYEQLKDAVLNAVLMRKHCVSLLVPGLTFDGNGLVVSDMLHDFNDGLTWPLNTPPQPEPAAPAATLPPPDAVTLARSQQSPPWSVADDIAFADAVAREDLRFDLEEYYRSSHWRIVLEQFTTGRCSMCAHDDRRTTLHHRHYRTLGCERREDLTEVCFECHERYHGLRRAA